VFLRLTGKEGMGAGDFKLLAALGAWFGWQALPLLILLSSVMGAVCGILAILLAGHDRRAPIPFGPFLALAGLTGLYFPTGLRLSAWLG
jgi:leader peptidase (prepilin peptidase)/N-methyltransferase